MKTIKLHLIVTLGILVTLNHGCDKCTNMQDANTRWTQTYGGSDFDRGRSVQETLDGGYIIAGYTRSFGAGSRDVYLIKTNPYGDTLWTHTYGGAGWDDGYSVQQTLDEGYIIAGSTNSFGAGMWDVYLIKTDTYGNTIWTQTYGGAGWDDGHSVQQTSDGGYIIAGSTRSFGAGSRDVYLIKTDTSGNALWTQTYGGSDYDDSDSVQQTSDGGYIIIGSKRHLITGKSDVYLIKTDSSGDTLWTQTYGGSSSDFGNSVQQTSDGGYIIAGSTSSFGAGKSDAYLIKTDPSGNILWTQTYGGSDGDGGSSVQQTSDGGYIIAGSTISFDVGVYDYDVYLIKTDANGNLH